MLVYNLVVSKPGIRLSAARLNDANQDLNAIFGKWEQEVASHPGQTPRNFVYLLERPLGDSDLRLESLRGEDHLKACHLMTAGQTNNICFFLATMKYTVTRYLDEESCDEDHCPCCLQNAKDNDAWVDVEERTCRLTAIFTTEGERIAKGVKINDLSVIQDQVFGPNSEPDEYVPIGRSQGGGDRNDSDSDGDPYLRGLACIYHRSCVVLVPRDFRFDLLNGKRPTELIFDIWIKLLLQETQEDSLYMASKEELKKLCRCIVENRVHMSVAQEASFNNALEEVVTVALRLNDPELFQSILSCPVAEKLQLTVFDKVGLSMARLDLSIWHQRSVSVLQPH